MTDDRPEPASGPRLGLRNPGSGICHLPSAIGHPPSPIRHPSREPPVPKQLIFSDAARRKMLEGVDILAHAVGTTLGPTGRNVILAKSFGGPTVTKDGVTVSKEIELPDPFENMGAKLVNVVASKTSDVAGDGTTTATILARSIYREGLRSITSGASPTAIRRGIEKAVETAVDELREKISRAVSKKEEIAQ